MVLLSPEDEMATQPQDSLDVHAAFASRMAEAGIQPQHRIAIAVSGGPDSMALCVLARRWWQGFREAGVYSERPRGIVVDHGLRPESAEEALQVQRWVSNLGMECDVLKCEWLNGRPDSGHLQEAARNARYSLMEQTCWKHDVGILLTGHHADDQAELFMMRLARKSGIIGLAGMAFVSHLFSRRPTSKDQTSLLLVRPLLQFSKQDLYTVCKNAGQEWVEDPTNLNRTFARNRIRQVLADPLYDDARRDIHRLIAACRQTRAVLDKERDELLAKAVTVSKDLGYVAIDTGVLASSNVSDAVLGRVLVAVLQFVAQREKPPRGKALKILMDKLREPSVREAFTLAGCHVSPAPRSRGTKVMVCLSPESPTPTLESDLISWESTPLSPSKNHLPPPQISTLTQNPILDATTPSQSILTQGKNLGLISETSLTLLESLRDEVAATMTKTIEECKKASPLELNTTKAQILPLGHTCFFTSRFLVSWEPKKVHSMTLSGDQRGRCCLLRDTPPPAFVRHYEDTDFDHLQAALKTSFKTKREDKVSTWCVYRFESDLYGGDEARRRRMVEEMARNALKKDTSRKKKMKSNVKVEPVFCGGVVAPMAQRALAILRCIPRPVRRGLPVLVNAEGLLLAIPTLGFQRCPWVSFSAVLRPRTPLGGGPASWT